MSASTNPPLEGQWDALIEKAQELERLAEDAQAEVPSQWTNEQALSFAFEFRKWYAAAAELLPENLREQFDREWNGRWTARLKDFVANPTQPGTFAAEYRTSPLISYWRNPFDQVRNAFHSQQTILHLARQRSTQNVQSIIPRNPSAVFIAHGRDRSYLEIANFLRDDCNLIPIFFETLDHTSEQMSEILEGFLKEASAAIIVMTPEDETTDGRQLARQNVVHEAGLFHAELGFDRVALLKDESVSNFSNAQGLIYVSLNTNQIDGCFWSLKRWLGRLGLDPVT